MSAQIFHTQIQALASALPLQKETGEDLIRDNPEWILEKILNKTGILNRYIASAHETAIDLAEKAAQNLFSDPTIDPSSIDALIFVTQSAPDRIPAAACQLQHRLKLSTRTIAFDINQGCSGYIYGLFTAANLIESGSCKSILLICADTYTKFIDAHDRRCRPLFSDAATATLLTRSATPQMGPFLLGTDGSGYYDFHAPQGKPMQMDGKKIIEFAQKRVPGLVRALFDQAHLPTDSADHFLFHQASKIVLEKVQEDLQLPEEKLFHMYNEIGNCTSSSLPLLYEKGINTHRIHPGSLSCMVSFGVGFSWGATLYRNS